MERMQQVQICQEGIVLTHWLSRWRQVPKLTEVPRSTEGFKTEAGEMGKTQRGKMFSLVLHQSQLYGRVTTGK